MGLNDRMRRFIAQKGLTVRAFELTVGLSNGAVSKMGDDTRSATIDKISEVYPELSRSWLMTGEGEMLTSATPSDGVVATPLPDKESYDFAKRLGMVIVPEYTDHFRGGGDGSMITSDNIDAYWGLPNIKADIIAEIDGDSMYPKYPPGSKVALRELSFDPSAPTVGIPFGEVFGITLDNGAGNYLNFIKRLRRHSDPALAQTFWTCQSENTAKYDDFDIEVAKVRHLFVVVASIHLNRM